MDYEKTSVPEKVARDAKDLLNPRQIPEGEPAIRDLYSPEFIICYYDPTSFGNKLQPLKAEVTYREDKRLQKSEEVLTVFPPDNNGEGIEIYIEHFFPYDFVDKFWPSVNKFWKKLWKKKEESHHLRSPNKADPEENSKMIYSSRPINDKKYILFRLPYPTKSPNLLIVQKNTASIATVARKTAKIMKEAGKYVFEVVPIFEVSSRISEKVLPPYVGSTGEKLCNFIQKLKGNKTEREFSEELEKYFVREDSVDPNEIKIDIIDIIDKPALSFPRIFGRKNEEQRFLKK
jgi:hypothetical protein